MNIKGTIEQLKLHVQKKMINEEKDLIHYIQYIPYYVYDYYLEHREIEPIKDNDFEIEYLEAKEVLKPRPLKDSFQQSYAVLVKWKNEINSITWNF